jgi:hypothetical protein
VDIHTRTDYVVDSHNHTGYQQVVVETVTDLEADPDAWVKTVVYTFGLDEVSQK